MFASQIVFNPAASQIRPGKRVGNRAIFCDDTDVFRSIDKDAIAREQFIAFIEAWDKFVEELINLRNEILGKIANLSAHARVGSGETRASQQFEKIIKFFALGERVKEDRHGPQVESHCAETHQM